MDWIYLVIMVIVILGLILINLYVLPNMAVSRQVVQVKQGPTTTIERSDGRVYYESDRSDQNST